MAKSEDQNACSNPERPELHSGLRESEFSRWYWTMAELQPFARSLGLSASGRKQLVSSRIACCLSGLPQPEEEPLPKTTDSLPANLDLETVIPTGQRSTQALRQFFAGYIGDSFSFNGHMRHFLRDSDGATLADAIEHWYDTRGLELPQQSASLEFNAFTKEWHQVNTAGTATEARVAWHRFRSLPVDQRPPPGQA